ncbi:MAG: hypothetical protein M1284_03655 [Candidatus Parvarchaeota archaeon]|nr:hypothetical protein [Candidatus Parvarchaeota archaeon]
MQDNQSIDNGTQIPVASPVSEGGGKKRNILPVIAVVIVAIVVIFIFASYKGYVPFIHISSSSNPYYNVANIKQLGSVVTGLSNTSGPFNLSYSLLLNLGARAGSSSFSFSLPINGHIAHYSPYTRAVVGINLLALIKSISALNTGVNLSSFPSFLDQINITAISNKTGGDICVPFGFLAKAGNQSASSIGFMLNDSSAQNSSLFCIGSTAKNAAENLSYLSSLLNINGSAINSSSAVNLSQSKYLTVKFVKDVSYNGNSCSLVDINTTSAFESKQNASMSFDFCFSNSYGVPLYGGFILNLSKESSQLSALLTAMNISKGANLSNIVFSAKLQSSFNPAPLQNAVSLMPAGSYTMNLSQLTSLINLARQNSGSGQGVTASSNGFSPFTVTAAICNSTQTTVAFSVGGLPYNATSATLDNMTLFSPSGFTGGSFPVTDTKFSTSTVTPGSSFTAVFPATCSTPGAQFIASGELDYNVTTVAGTVDFYATGTIAGTSS